MLKVVILGAEEATAVTSIHKCFNDLVQMTRTSLLRLNNFIKKQPQPIQTVSKARMITEKRSVVVKKLTRVKTESIIAVIFDCPWIQDK
jgi:hypothetical protein